MRPWLPAAFAAAGALSVVPGFAFYALAAALGLSPGGDRWGVVVFTWTVNAPVEELAKFLGFALTARILKSIREPQDGSLQGAATGLGFGLVENLLYGLSGGPGLFLVRTLVSLPGHLIYGAVWGGYYGFEVYQGRGRVRRPWVPLLALVPAGFSHALYNTLAVTGAPLVWALAADALTLGFGLFLFVGLRSHSPRQKPRPLREWALAIPELDHALALDPGSTVLRQRLAAYLLAGNQADRALGVLEPLPDDPWTLFYRDAARRRLGPRSPDLPGSASLNLPLFRALSGG